MRFEDLANFNPKEIDPCVFNFLCNLIQIRSKATTVFSCQGHRKGEPAWVQFDIHNKHWWSALKLPDFCKVDGETVYVYHKNKYPDLFRKLNELQDAMLVS